MLQHLQRAGSHFYYLQNGSVFKRMMPDMDMKNTMVNEAVHRQVKDWGRCVYKCHRERIILGGSIFGVYKCLAHASQPTTCCMRENWRIAVIAGRIAAGITSKFERSVALQLVTRSDLRTPIVRNDDDRVTKRKEILSSQHAQYLKQQEINARRTRRRAV